MALGTALAHPAVSSCMALRSSSVDSCWRSVTLGWEDSMRSIRMLAALTGILTLASACGDGGGTEPPPNRPPVAGFTEVCTQLSCVFTDASTDPDGNTTITGRSWNFG